MACFSSPRASGASFCTGTGQFPRVRCLSACASSASLVTAAALRSAVLGLVPLSWKAASIRGPLPLRACSLSCLRRLQCLGLTATQLCRPGSSPLLLPAGGVSVVAPAVPRASPPRTSACLWVSCPSPPCSATRSCLSGRASAVQAAHSGRWPRRLYQLLGAALLADLPGPRFNPRRPLPLLCLRLSSGHHASLEKMRRPRPWSQSTFGP